MDFIGIMGTETERLFDPHGRLVVINFLLISLVRTSVRTFFKSSESYCGLKLWSWPSGS